jgi:hypothetical protein
MSRHPELYHWTEELSSRDERQLYFPPVLPHLEMLPSAKP